MSPIMRRRRRAPVDGDRPGRPDNRSIDLTGKLGEQIDQLRELVENLREVAMIHIEAERTHVHGRSRPEKPQ